MTDENSRLVTRRKVFYVPGFDPIHPRRYRELYRKEGAAQAGISGYELALRGKQGGGPYGWHVDACIDGQEVYADVEVLIWSDLVRKIMSPSIGATYLASLRMAWTYISTGTLSGVMRLRKGPVIAALYPVAALILYLLVALLVARLGAGALIWVLGALGVPAAFIWGAGMVLGLGLMVLVLRWFRAQDGRFYTYYLVQNYAFSSRLNGEIPPELSERLAEFGARIKEALSQDYDEVLVVGHSSGAHLSVTVLADLLRAQDQVGPALGFLSVGQVMPMVSFLPDAYRLRGDLQYLSESAALTWVDVTAPGDGCAFALCDPVAVCGVARAQKRWPLVVSAAFSQTLSPARWKELRWRFFRLHFQYLCAFDNPGDYDYFQITAGPRTLSARYAGRAPSKSRLEKAVSRHQSVTP